METARHGGVISKLLAFHDFDLKYLSPKISGKIYV